MEEERNISRRSFLGTGWSFPPTFSRVEESVVMVSDEEDIQQSLEILLSTSIGERIIELQYGCNLKNFLFDTVNQGMRTYLEDMIKTAILYHEARIELPQVRLGTERQYEGVLMVNLEYTIRGTNSRYNMVYPFYLEEGVGAFTTP